MPFDGTHLSQVKRDLIAGRQLLIEKGWVPRCGDRSGRGPHCVMTANEVSAKGKQRRLAALEALMKAAGFDGHPLEIAFWNDHQISIDPVLALYDKAIATA